MGRLPGTLVQAVPAMMDFHEDPMGSPSNILIDSQPPYYWVYSGKRSEITVKTNEVSYRANLCCSDTIWGPVSNGPFVLQ